jgi:hypothetical protein
VVSANMLFIKKKKQPICYNLSRRGHIILNKQPICHNLRNEVLNFYMRGSEWQKIQRRKKNLEKQRMKQSSLNKWHIDLTRSTHDWDLGACAPWLKFWSDYLHEKEVSIKLKYPCRNMFSNGKWDKREESVQVA